MTTDGFAWATAPRIVSGSVNGQYISPYYTTTENDAASYYAVQKGETATMSVLSSAAKGLSLLWGTMDNSGTWNRIAFMLDGKTVATVSGADVFSAGGSLSYANGGADHRSAQVIGISGITFDRVDFFAGNNSFEFANVEITPVPLPAAGVLLLAALGGLAGLRRLQSPPA